jgi:hypothetical protein
MFNDGAMVTVGLGEGKYIPSKTARSGLPYPGTPSLDRAGECRSIGADDGSGMVLTKVSENEVRLPVQIDKGVDVVDEPRLIHGTEKLHAIEERCLIAETYDPYAIKLVEGVSNPVAITCGELVINYFQTRVLDVLD